MPAAINAGDHARALLPAFRRRVERALEVVSQAAAQGRLGVSYSGGKDSTVLLDLVREIKSDAPAAFYDSGLEYPGTYEMVAHYGVQTIQPQMSLAEMCRYGGYWGHQHPTDPDAEFDFFSFLVAEPSWRFICEHDLQVIAIGLRGQESKGRLLSARKRGELYWIERRQMWHCCPLAYWRDEEVWAYIASRGLRYNPAYDKMAALNIPRSRWRVGMLLGIPRPGLEDRYSWLRQMEPALWNCLVAEFPRINDYT